MKRPTDKGLTRLANAAFRQAAQKVLELAERTGTPVIIYVDGEVKAVDPRTLKRRSARRRLRRSGRRRSRKMDGQ